MPVSVLGKPNDRPEGRAKVTGRAAYTADRTAPRLAHACGIMSPIAAGEIVSIDTSAADAAPGVLAVYHPDRRPPLFRVPEGVSVGERRPPLEDRRIHYAGQFVAAVVAETFEQARWATHLVKIRYRAAAPVVSLDAGEAAHGAKPKGDDTSRGDPEPAFTDAAVQVDATYSTPVEVHCNMEMHAALARWEGDRLLIDDSTQYVSGHAEALAYFLGIGQEKISVRSHFVGGGFGSKLFVWPHAVLAAAAARELGRPVKIVLDRRSQFTSAGHRPHTRQRVRLGADRDGRLVSVRHDSLSHTSLVQDYVESCAQVTPSLYACAHVATTHRIVPVNVGTPTPMRGPGEVPGLFAVESALDELAIALSLDPLELRLRNIPDRDEAKDLPWSINTMAECLRLAADRFGWAGRNPDVGSMRDGDIVLGWGLAAASWSASRDEAKVRAELRADGTLRLTSGTQDPGTGTYAVISQVGAEISGLPPAQIEVAIGENSMPVGPISGGSMATASLVPAVAEATRKAIKQLIKVATKTEGPWKDQDPDTLRVQGDQLLAADGRALGAWRDVLRQAQLALVAGDAHTEPGDEREKFSFRSWGAHCAEIRWDPGLAKVTVSRVVSVLDTGRIINHKTASNQVYGSLVMGLGMALLEHSVYDPRSGAVVTDNLADYLVPVHTDVPEMDVTLLDRPDPHIGEFGARGIGEIGLTGIAAAIANAVHHATGKRIRDLPITIERLLA